MALKSTNLFVQAAPLPPTFRGTPQELYRVMIQRMKILSPNGTNFIFIGDVEPTSNVGPWLKDGTKWYVWDTEIKRYVPLDISDSLTLPFYMGASTPPNSTPPVWLLTTKDATDVDPSHGDPVGWYVFNGANWVPFVSIVLSGPTGSRPANPEEYQQYYDTTIACLIWWERSSWRTVSGVPGDVKHVAYPLLTEALNANPGWNVFGSANQSWRGRLIVQAATDGETTLTTDPHVAQRDAFETFGQDQGITASGSLTITVPPQIALWTLVKE